MAACFVSAHSIMDTPHFSGDTVHGVRNRNVHMNQLLKHLSTPLEISRIAKFESVRMKTNKDIALQSRKILQTFVWGGGGQGGRRPGEKGVGGIREAGEEGAGSGIPKVAGIGRKRENYATLRSISQSKNAKRWEPKNTGREPGLKGRGNRRF